MNSRHAYCIIAHNDAYCLQTLLDCIDDRRNDIYLLVDKKAPSELRNSVSAQLSKLHVIPENESIDVRWGDISQIEAELTVFSRALSGGEYSYIHLLSGQDLPLKSQDEIHQFFANLAPGTNLVGLAQDYSDKRDLDYKTRYYHFFTAHYRPSNKFVKNIYYYADRLLLKAQRYIGVKRKYEGVKLYKGANWVSITPEFCKFLVENDRYIKQLFRYVPCADEMYKQTLLMNSDFRNTIYDATKDLAGNTRYVDWERGRPYTWRAENFDELMSAEALFARKFSSEVDKAVIDKIKEKLIYEKNN